MVQQRRPATSHADIAEKITSSDGSAGFRDPGDNDRRLRLTGPIPVHSGRTTRARRALVTTLAVFSLPLLALGLASASGAAPTPPQRLTADGSPRTTVSQPARPAAATSPARHTGQARTATPANPGVSAQAGTGAHGVTRGGAAGRSAATTGAHVAPGTPDGAGARSGAEAHTTVPASHVAQAHHEAVLPRPSGPGAVETFGDAPFLGAPGKSGPDLVGVALVPGSNGYWAVDTAGHVFAFGSAHLFGSLGSDPGAGPIAAIAATPTGRGYWLVSRHGGVFTFGDARYYGSLGKTLLPTPVTAMATSDTGHGYWLTTANGGVYSFGDARFYGSLGSSSLGRPVVGIAPAPTGRGYWVATAGGGVFSFGAARFYGSLGLQHQTVSAIAAPAAKQGYWLLAPGGKVYSFGAVGKHGSATTPPGSQASALAATSTGSGYVVVTTRASAAPRLEVSRVEGAETPAAPPALTPLGTFMVTCYDLTGPTASGALARP